MSKRPPTSGNPANAPVAKKSRIDIDITMTEVKTLSTQLLDSLKAQKATVQWGHTTCREDTISSIAKAESLIGSVEKLEKKAKDASISVDNLIDALVESEVDSMPKALGKYNGVADDYDEMPEANILEGLQQYHWTLKHDVKKQLKEKLKDLTVDEVIKKVHAETKNAYKEAAKKRIANILENVLG